MTYENIEESRQLGEPVTLYYFKYGDNAGQFYAYTDAEQTISEGGVDYQPIPIQRTKVSASGSLDKAAVNIRTSVDTGLSELFKIYPPSQVVTCEIRQGHLNDPSNEFLVIWSGRVISANREVRETQFTCEPISTSLRRSGLRRHYQFLCPHVLYGPQCKANKAAATTSTVVTVISGNVINVQVGTLAEAVGKYTNGTVEWTDASGVFHVRTILKGTGTTTLTLSGPPTGLEILSAVDVILGCNRQMSDCTALHNNIQNFGGQPWIPTKNPIGAVNNFY